MTNKINWLAVVVTTVVGMALGFLYYGALFQDIWMAGNGLSPGATDTEMIRYGETMEVSAMPMILNTISLVVYALLMNWLVGKTGMTTWAGGATVGAVIGGIILIYTIITNLFAANPISLSLVDGTYAFLLMVAAGAIMGGWRKS